MYVNKCWIFIHPLKDKNKFRRNNSFGVWYEKQVPEKGVGGKVFVFLLCVRLFATSALTSPVMDFSRGLNFPFKKSQCRGASGEFVLQNESQYNHSENPLLAYLHCVEDFFRIHSNASIAFIAYPKECKHTSANNRLIIVT